VASANAYRPKLMIPLAVAVVWLVTATVPDGDTVTVGTVDT